MTRFNENVCGVVGLIIFSAVTFITTKFIGSLIPGSNYAEPIVTIQLNANATFSIVVGVLIGLAVSHLFSRINQ